MKTNRYLLPTYFKKIGWLISVPLAVVLAVYLFSQGLRSGGMTAENYNFFGKMFDQPYHRVLDLLSGSEQVLAVCMIALMAGLFFIAFAREKIEDEFITKLRGDSLIWAVIANSVLLVISFALVYDWAFLYVSFLNLYLLLVLYIVKFRIALYRFKKSNSHEE